RAAAVRGPVARRGQGGALGYYLRGRRPAALAYAAGQSDLRRCTRLPAQTVRVPRRARRVRGRIRVSDAVVKEPGWDQGKSGFSACDDWEIPDCAPLRDAPSGLRLLLRLVSAAGAACGRAIA